MQFLSIFAEEEFDINIEIKKLNIVKSLLNIGVKITGKYNPEIRNPILTIVFTSQENYRRLPLPIKVYEPCEKFDKFIILAEFTYSIRDIYIDEEPNKINIRFELSYGNELYTDLLYEMPKELNIFGSKLYSLSIKNDSAIEIVKCSEKPSLLIISFKNVVSFLWNFILLLISMFLLPIFMVEALLSATNLISSDFSKKYSGVLGIVEHLRWRVSQIFNRKIGLGDFKNLMTKLGFNLFKFSRVKKNRVAFISCRRNTLTGNFEYIYNELKRLESKKLEFVTVLDSKESFLSCFKYGYYLATSKIILVDDYIRSIYEIKKRHNNYLIQVWHACGAFKIFGFSRLDKEGCWSQNSRSHRTYDYCTVSSENVAKFYAEAFGLSISKIKATGVPRTDIFFDNDYKNKIRRKFYENHPCLKDKKIILFAPTFRGKSKKAGYYPHRYFDYETLIKKFGSEYFIIIKHHPFVNNKLVIPEKYNDNIINLSDNEEVNDLLFITDLLITDYSSLIFEASLLKISMIFYTFDLYDYIDIRGFYFEFLSFVPGKIVYNIQELIKAIEEEDFEAYKIENFRNKFFDKFDGKSSERISKFILACIDDM